MKTSKSYHVLSRILALIDKVSGAAGVLAALLIVPLVLITCYEVIARYVFGAPTSWAFELGYMLTGASFVLGCAYTLRERAHIRIDVFYNKFPVRVRAAIMVFGYVFVFLPVVLWLSFGLFEYALEAYASGERTGQSAWNPHVYPFRFILSFGFACLSLQAIASMTRHALVLFGGDVAFLRTGKTARSAEEVL